MRFDISKLIHQSRAPGWLKYFHFMIRCATVTTTSNNSTDKDPQKGTLKTNILENICNFQMGGDN